MTDINNDDVKKLLEMLKEHTEQPAEDKTNTQTTDNSIHSDDDIKNMLKKHFSAGESVDTFETGEDYSFETVDFGRIDDDIITSEIVTEETVDAVGEIPVTEESDASLEEQPTELPNEYEPSEPEEDQSEMLELNSEESKSEPTMIEEVFEDRDIYFYSLGEFN